VKEFASLGIGVVAALFLALLTTLRPSTIVAVQGDKVIDVAPMKQGLASEDSSRAGTPPQNARTDWAAEISTHPAR
jgi:hypothetical protein